MTNNILNKGRERIRIKQILFSKNFSLIGTTIFNIILNLWILQETGSVSELGLIVSITSISSLIFSFLGGYLADTIYLKKILLVMDLLSAILCVFALFLINSKNYSSIYILVFLLNINVSITSPIFKKMISIVVLKQHIMHFNSKIAITGEIIKISIPVFATFLFQRNIVSLSTAIIINMISFILSFYYIKSLKFKTYEKNKKKSGYLQAIKYAFGFKIIVLLLLTGAVSNFFLAGFNLILPQFAVNISGNSSYYGILIAFEAVGGLIGSYSIKFLKLDYSIYRERTGIMFSGILLVLTVVFNSIILLSFICFLLNFFYIRYNIVFQSFIQSEISDDYIGKIFSISYIMSGIFLPLGSLFLGKVIEYNYFFGVITVGIGLVAINLFWIINNKKVRIVNDGLH